MRVKVMKVDGDGDFESTSGMVDTCHGDSGGPLACQVPHQHQGQLYFFIAICIAIMTIMFITNIPTFSYQFLLQTGDGSYKLVGIVNWGGGYCGEVCLFLWVFLPIFSTGLYIATQSFLNFPLCSPENLGFTRECNITTSGSER